MDFHSSPVTAHTHPARLSKLRRVALNAAVGGFALLLLAGCTPAPSSEGDKPDSSTSSEFPVIDGEIASEGETADSNGVRVVVRSSASDLLAAAADELKAAGFDVRQTSEDSLGATSEDYFVSASLRAGEITYIFVPR
ncbi:hypothetical protein [Microbacterium sp. NPDC055665]